MLCLNLLRHQRNNFNDTRYIIFHNIYDNINAQHNALIR